MEEVLISKVPDEYKNTMLQDVYRYKWKYNEINLDDMLQRAYNIVLDMGGDAICNFKILSNDQHFSNAEGYPSVVVPGIKITGFVIKRK